MTTGLARTIEEMQFAAGLEPCPGCGLREIGMLAIDGDGTRWTCEARCPRCGVSRTFQFHTAKSPWANAVELDELGPRTSGLVTEEQLLSVMKECGAGVPDRPDGLTPRQRQRLLARIERALVAAGELLKMVPPPTQPQSADPELQRQNVSAEYKRLFVLAARYAPPNTISLAALEAHKDWIERGAHGDDGYLLIERRSLVGERYGSWNLSFIRIAHSDLTRVDMSESVLFSSDLEDVFFTSANLWGTSFADSYVRGGSWTKASMARANFNGVEALGTNFSRSSLDRSTWFNAKISDARFDGVDFGNSCFDGAVFTRCSFRDARFARFMSEPVPTSIGTQFVGCDFTGTDWTDRDLGHTAFVDCVFAGAHGKPCGAEGLVVSGAIDAAALLRQLR